MEKLGGPSIKLDKDEDREKSIRRFCVTLYQNIAGRRKPPSGSLEQNKLAKLQEEVAEYEAELPKDPLRASANLFCEIGLPSTAVEPNEKAHHRYPITFESHAGRRRLAQFGVAVR